MALRSPHGKGARTGPPGPRVEVPPVDELEAGVQDPEQVHAGLQRLPNGRWPKGATQDQSKGGRSRARTIKLAHSLGLGPLAVLDEFRPFIEMAEDLQRTQMQHLATNVGGGYCGPAPSSFVASSALQLAASRYWFGRGTTDRDRDLFQLSSRLANESRQNLLAAHHLCALEAKARLDGGRSYNSPGAAALPASTGPGFYEPEPEEPTS